MQTDVVVGLQWGDEGKGKIVDLIANNYNAIIRANGGNNAGHSISINDKEYAVHSLPSGVLQKDMVNIIAPGCVVNPNAIVKEINTLGEDFVGNLFISDRCPLIMSYHIEQDIENEKNRGGNSIGTTLKGIGPCYAALKNRDVFFAGDLLNIENSLIRYSHLEQSVIENIRIELNIYKDLIGKFICDTFSLIQKQELTLLEGAQATMLDNLYGTYPYVTSSNTIVSGLLSGSSLNHSNVRNVIGVTKAYATRVGNGPFITEETGEIGEKIRTIGKEIGVSTGRKRRTGWLDLVQLNYAIQLNGINQLSIMKSDVLDSFEEIKICIAYQNIKTQEKINYIPFDLELYEPIYQIFEGWNTKTYGETNISNLPKKLVDYLTFIESQSGVKIKYISTGPERNQTILI